MKLLLILGCTALGILLVAASHQDQTETGIEAKNEGIQGDFVDAREIRPTGGNNKKKTKPIRKPPPGAFSAVSIPSKTLAKRNIKDLTPQPGKRRGCRGCFSALSNLKPEKELHIATLALRQQRDTEEHGKLKKKQKHLKEKSKSKRRRKNHRDKHPHLQEEDPEIRQNNKRNKHHRGKKDKVQLRAGSFTVLSKAPLDTKKMDKDISDMQDMTA